jgi:hypothetical protein
MPDSLFPRPAIPGRSIETPWLAPPVLAHLDALLSSYLRLLGQELTPPASLLERAAVLWQSPLVLVSHDAEADPTFVYANRTALGLWEMTWAEFTTLKSRESAEPVEQAERERLLHEVEETGFSANYAGIRRTRNGRRFRIEGVTVWEVHDAAGRRLGQAASFDRWTFL